MNTLISKYLTKSSSTNFKVFNQVCRRNFSSTQVNPYPGANFLANFEDKETLSKLVEKDVDYFVNLSESRGAEEILKRLANISEKVDATTKFGRELINTKNDVVKRIVYQNRTIEDHENMSKHICEKELFHVYAQHVKQLAEKINGVEYFQSKSVGNSRLIYEYTQNFYSSKYFLSPLFIIGVPSALAVKYSLHLQLLFGSLTPQLVILGSLYLAASRYKWLTSSSYIKDGNIARKVSLEDQNTLLIESMQFFSMKTHRLNLNSVQIRFVENEFRRDPYYLIKDLNSKKTFILPIDDKALADRKFINWLSTVKNDDKYSITSTLIKGSNLIDVSANRQMKNEIDNFARLNLMAELYPEIDLSTLTPRELHEKINLIPDAQVREYLERAKNQVEKKQPAGIETALVEVENFLTSVGLTSEEAVNITKFLRKNFKIAAVSDLKYLSNSELSEALENNSQRSKFEVDSLRKEIQLFFKKF